MSRVLDTALATIRELVADQLDTGEQLPTEKELVEQLGVSRATVRDAITQLAADGLVTKVWGVGTFAAEAGPRTAFGMLSLSPGIPGMLDTAGGISTIHSFEAVVYPPDADLFPDFATAQTTIMNRVLAIDGVPVVVVADHFVSEFDGGRVDISPLQATDALMVDVMKLVGVEFKALEMDLFASDLSLADQQRLGLTESEAVISTEGLGYDGEGRCMLRTQASYRTKIMRLRVVAS